MILQQWNKNRCIQNFLKQNFFSQKKILAALGLILLLATVLRVWGLGKNTFVADEFIDLNASYGYTQTDKWKAWNFNLEQIDAIDPYDARDERSWVYRWQVAQIFSFLPVDESSARSVSVFWGTITTLFLFWSAKVFTQNTAIALLAAFFFAVSPTGIEYDRKLRMYAMFIPVFLIFSTLLFLLLEKPKKYGKRFVLFLSGKNRFGIHFFLLPFVIAAGALSVHLQPLTVNIVFSLFGYLLTLVVLSHFFPALVSSSKNALWILGLFLAGTIVTFIFFPNIPQNILGTSQFFMDNYGYGEKILRDFQHPLLGATFVFFGFYFLFFRFQKPKEALWLLSSFLVPLLLTIFIWERTQGTQYIVYLFPFIFLLCATGVAGAAQWLKEHIPSISKKRIAFATFLFAILFLPRYGYFFEEQNTYDRGNDPVADYRKVFAYLKKSHRKEPHALITRNFRNYSYRGWNTPVLDFGGERADHNLSKNEIINFICSHPKGFAVIFDNDWDFVSKEGRAFIETSLARIDHSSVRGAAKAYAWDETDCIP